MPLLPWAKSKVDAPQAETGWNAKQMVLLADLKERVAATPIPLLALSLVALGSVSTIATMTVYRWATILGMIFVCDSCI
jgi:hypothetical protein